MSQVSNLLRLVQTFYRLGTKLPKNISDKGHHQLAQIGWKMAVQQLIKSDTRRVLDGGWPENITQRARGFNFQLIANPVVGTGCRQTKGKGSHRIYRHKLLHRLLEIASIGRHRNGQSLGEGAHTCLDESSLPRYHSLCEIRSNDVGPYEASSNCYYDIDPRWQSFIVPAAVPGFAFVNLFFERTSHFHPFLFPAYTVKNHDSAQLWRTVKFLKLLQICFQQFLALKWVALTPLGDGVTKLPVFSWASETNNKKQSDSLVCQIIHFLAFYCRIESRLPSLNKYSLTLHFSFQRFVIPRIVSIGLLPSPESIFFDRSRLLIQEEHPMNHYVIRLQRQIFFGKQPRWNHIN